MLIDIKSLGHKEGHNCLEAILATLSPWWKRDYEMIFIDSWGFIYYPPKGKTLGNRIDTGNFKLWDNLHKYHNVLPSWKYSESMEERFSMIRSEISQKRPLIMHTDGYYIPWIKVYNMYHRDHTCLIIGIDEQDNLMCLDPFWNTDINILPKENFVLSDSTCTTVCLEDEKNSFIWEEELKKSVENLMGEKNRKSSFEMIRDFATDLYNLVNLSEEIKGCEEWPYAAPLFMQLFKIAHARLNFGTALKYLGKRFDKSCLYDYAERLGNIKGKWSDAIHILLPVVQAESYKSELGAFKNILYEIADEEESIANALLKL